MIWTLVKITYTDPKLGEQHCAVITDDRGAAIRRVIRGLPMRLLPLVAKAEATLKDGELNPDEGLPLLKL